MRRVVLDIGDLERGGSRRSEVAGVLTHRSGVHAPCSSIAGPRGGGTPAVAFTALAGERERERCLAAGFQAHLAKPATRAAVLAAVKSLLAPTRRAAPATPDITSSGS